MLIKYLIDNLRCQYNGSQRSGLGVVAEFEKPSARYDSLVKLIS